MSAAKMPEPVAWTVTVGEDFANCIEITHSKEDAQAQYEASAEGGYESLYLLRTLITTEQAEAYAAAKVREAQQWLPIDTAPKDGGTILLGYFNSHGNWRTVRGQWMSEDYIAEHWENPDDAEPGWFETAVEADDIPNCWRIWPTHWMPLPAPPQQ